MKVFVIIKLGSRKLCRHVLMYLQADLMAIKTWTPDDSEWVLLPEAAAMTGYHPTHLKLLTTTAHNILCRPIKHKHASRPSAGGAPARLQLLLCRADVETISNFKKYGRRSHHDREWLTYQEACQKFPSAHFAQTLLSRWATKWCVHLGRKLRIKRGLSGKGFHFSKTITRYSREDLEEIARHTSKVNGKRRRFVGIELTDSSGEWASFGKVLKMLGLTRRKLDRMTEKRLPMSAALPLGRIRIKPIDRPTATGTSARKIKAYNIADVRYVNELRARGYPTTEAPAATAVKTGVLNVVTERANVLADRARVKGRRVKLSCTPVVAGKLPSQQPGPTAPAGFDPHSVQQRNALFAEWYDNAELATYHSPANIRDNWNKMFPQAGVGDCKDGIDLVKKGMVRAREARV